jgi:hypothetical protein
MASLYKVLAQSAPSAGVETLLYTVPSATQAIVSSIYVCNRGASVATFRVSVRWNGETLGNRNYIAYDVSIDPNETIVFGEGVTLSSVGGQDIVSVRSSSGNVSFSAFGTEVS